MVTERTLAGLPQSIDIGSVNELRQFTPPMGLFWLIRLRAGLSWSQSRL